MVSPIAASTAPPVDLSQASPETLKARDAAHQFEALLIGQMLKSMKDSEGGWMGTGDDQSSSSAMEYAQEVFAQALASGGGLGLATLVEGGLQCPKS
jgi:flagellar protein FlgJ